MVVILFGVSGAGKTTVGRLLAGATGYRFHDADDFHPPGNVKKLRNGVPLDEDDRGPWLRSLAAAIDAWLMRGENVVLACSALKRKHRKCLERSPEVRFVYLRGTYNLIAERLNRRRGHFMHPALLQNQFATLQEPAPGEAVVVDCGNDPAGAVEQIRRELEI